MPDNRRAPAEPKQISDIDPRQDIRVRLVGTVLEKGEDSVMVDDGSGTTEVFLDKEDVDRVDENDTVRIHGRVLPTPDSFEIQGEILQPMTEDEMELYQEASEVVGRI